MDTPRLCIVVLALLLAMPASILAEDPEGPRDSRRTPAADRTLPDRFGSGPEDRDGSLEPDPPPPAAPPPVDCESVTDPGERLACKAERVQSQVSRAVDSLTAPGANLLTERQKWLIRNARDRSDKERERTGARGFRRLAKKRDGVEWFVEEYDDPTGTDPEDDGNNDETIGRNAEEMFDDSALLLGDLNDELAARALWGSGPVSAATTDTDDLCANLLTGTRQFPYPVLQAAQAAANGVKLANDSCADASRQSSAGFNFSAACVPLAVSMNVLQLTQDAFELQDDAITGERVDNSAACLEQLGLEAKRNNDTVDGIADELEEARTRIEARLDELILLLNTPPGQRPDYPLPTGGMR